MSYQQPQLSKIRLICTNPNCKKIVEREINRTISTHVICDCGKSLKII